MADSTYLTGDKRQAAGWLGGLLNFAACNFMLGNEVRTDLIARLKAEANKEPEDHVSEFLEACAKLLEDEGFDDHMEIVP